MGIVEAKPAGEPVFLTGSLMRHVTVMSLTGSVGLMSIFAVDFIDMMFISMLGDDALAAAIGYAGTILFFTGSLNIGLSIAAGALVSRTLGARDRDKAREYATSVAALSVLLASAVAMLTLSNVPALLAALGAQGRPVGLAASYLAIMLPTMPVMALAMVALAVLRAHGDARRPMLATVAGGVVNAVLDPILIFAAGLGLDGAALASVAARFVILGAALWPAIAVHRGFAGVSVAGLRRDARAVLQLGIPAVCTNVATPMGTAIVMREMARFGTDAVAGMAVIARLTPVAFAVVFALSGAVGPIIGQNFGADRLDRVRAAFRAGLVFMALYILAAAAVLFVLRGPIAGFFAADGVARELIHLFCGPVALLFAANGAIFVSNAAFNNLGHPGYSAAINWGRNTLGTLPFVLIGAAWFGAAGVLVGQAIGGVVFAALAILLAHRLMGAAPVGAGAEPFVHQSRLHRMTCHRH